MHASDPPEKSSPRPCKRGAVHTWSLRFARNDDGLEFNLIRKCANPSRKGATEVAHARNDRRANARLWPEARVPWLIPAKEPVKELRDAGGMRFSVRIAGGRQRWRGSAGYSAGSAASAMGHDRPGVASAAGPSGAGGVELCRDASIFLPLYERWVARGRSRDGRPPTLRFCWRCGCTRRSKGWARRANWSGCAESDAAYRWLAGGVPLNYHGLADFRVEQVEVLDRLLTQSVTALIAEGLVSLARSPWTARRYAPAPGGRRSRPAKTCSRSRRRSPAVAALKAEVAADDADGASSRRRQAARERAARDVRERAAKARAALERLEAERARRAPRRTPRTRRRSRARASTTDPEARCMRFPDGAVRPAYNAQIAAAPKEGIIVSIEVTDRRNDAGLAGPMVDDIARRYDVPPKRLLVDTNYATSEDIIALAEHATGPVRCSPRRPPSERRRQAGQPGQAGEGERSEPDCLREWRARMASEAAQAIYGGASSSRGSTPTARTTDSARCSCAACGRGARWRCGTPSPTT